MGCQDCDYTGFMWDWDDEIGSDAQVPCPNCRGVDGEEPNWITDINDAATQAEIDEAWRQYELDKAE